jgi:diguanylate cyclase (GGDEF)-like protein
MLVFAASVPPLLIKKKHDGPAVRLMFCVALLFVFIALNFQSSIFEADRQYGILRGFMFGSGLVLAIAVLGTSWRHANIDELTGLPGRRQLYRHLGQLGSRYQIAIIDIDHFKKINDKYGHPAGDQVLKYVGTELRNERIGRAYRVGGEEFIIVVEGMERAAAVKALDELRKRILDRPFGIRAKGRKRRKPESGGKTSKRAADTVSISVSIGVAEPNERHGDSAAVVAAADKALYAAKKAGRNRVKIGR